MNALASAAFTARPPRRPIWEREAALRGGDANRLPDHAEFWSRLPLPFSLAEAWWLLAPEVQAEIGAAVIGMALAEYIHGDMMDEADCFHDESLRGEASDIANDTLNRMAPRLWSLFPDLYGPEGDHPRWALDSGLAA